MYNILVVDDEKMHRKGILSLLEEFCPEDMLWEAADGTEAMEIMQNMPCEIVISDIRMARMDGLSLLREVKNIRPEVSFIIISGYSDFEYAQSAIRLKVSEYLLKPVDPEELTTALGNIRKQYQIEQKAYEDIFNESMTRNSPEQIAATLRDYLVQNYNMDINLNLIAGSMHYSPSYLTKILQVSPLKFITQIRLSQAKHYLSHNPELSVKQVGEMIGYQDQGYFSRLFKKNTGVSPLDWRNR